MGWGFFCFLFFGTDVVLLKHGNRGHILSTVHVRGLPYMYVHSSEIQNVERVEKPAVLAYAFASTVNLLLALTVPASRKMLYTVDTHSFMYGMLRDILNQLYTV